jgi:hypothetical protein
MRLMSEKGRKMGAKGGAFWGKIMHPLCMKRARPPEPGTVSFRVSPGKKA